MLITFAVNLILLYLTFYAQTPRAMRPYAVIIRIHIFADLISETANFVTSIVYVAVGDIYYVTSLGILQWRITPNALRIAILVYNWLGIKIFWKARAAKRDNFSYKWADLNFDYRFYLQISNDCFVSFLAHSKLGNACFIARFTLKSFICRIAM